MNNNQNGSIITVAMICLLVLSLFGIFALNTSDYEIHIAANHQRGEKNFNLSEASVIKEGANLGFATAGSHHLWYEIKNPYLFNTHLFPRESISFDPSGKDMPVKGKFPDDFNPTNPDYWPRQNLLNDTADDTHDYAYLVTYLYFDTPPKGTDASRFSAYRFRINGKRKTEIEIGGLKIGPKPQINP